MIARDPGRALEVGGEPPRPEPVVRLMEEDDVEAVVALEQEAFSSPWQADTFRRLMTRDGTELWVLETAGDGVVGYAVLWWVQAHGELANIAVRAEHRGRGFGSRLLDRVLARAREVGIRNLYLEVRVSNELAAGLYERRGFHEIGRRRDYYQRPREDARVLLKRLR